MTDHGMQEYRVVYGLGETGLSCARYFARQSMPFFVMDDNPSPGLLPKLRELADDAFISPSRADVLKGACEIVVSPGVPLSTPALRDAASHGIPLTGDVALFGELAEAPIVAITGSNGKTTVTSLLFHLAGRQRKGVQCGGNIGTPCLDLLGDDVRLYILELSSYQLETACSLPTEISGVLNLEPDHMDRYPSVDAYYGAKAGIYHKCRKALVNRDIDWPVLLPEGVPVTLFGAGVPESESDFGLIHRGGVSVIVRGGSELISSADLRIQGRHNVINVMSALAMGEVLDLDMDAMIADVTEFAGLPHRCEHIGVFNGVTYYNDSKATNVAATISAIRSFGNGKGNLVLILGGQGKDADFSELARAAAGSVKHAVVFGQDRIAITGALNKVIPFSSCVSMDEALSLADQHAVAGDVVLFSPACASQDMFRDYQARGDAFRTMVKEAHA